MQVAHARVVRREVEEQRGTDVVRQVAHDAQVRGKRREIELERIGLMERELRRRERFTEPAGEIAVDFYGGDVTRAFDQTARQRGQPRPDLDEVLAWPRVDGVDDARRVVQSARKFWPNLLRAT
jgi:hypothetical protein